MVQDLCVLRPEYLILFKAKAYLDLSERKHTKMYIISQKSVYFSTIFDIIISRGGVFYEILYITDEGKWNKKHKQRNCFEFL